MTLLSKAGVNDDLRHSLVYHWTSGRTSSTKELSELELAQLIHRLETDYGFARKINMQVREQLRKKRSYILAIASKVGILEKNDWDKFNRFMKTRSVLHKPLYDYSLNELDDLLKQFRSIERNYEKSAKKLWTKAATHKYNFHSN